jgi:hypothetical protein
LAIDPSLVSSFFTNTHEECSVKYAIVDDDNKLLTGDNGKMIYILNERITIDPKYFKNTGSYRLRASSESGYELYKTIKMTYVSTASTSSSSSSSGT